MNRVLKPPLTYFTSPVLATTVSWNWVKLYFWTDWSSRYWIWDFSTRILCRLIKNSYSRDWVDSLRFLAPITRIGRGSRWLVESDRRRQLLPVLAPDAEVGPHISAQTTSLRFSLLESASTLNVDGLLLVQVQYFKWRLVSVFFHLAKRWTDSHNLITWGDGILIEMEKYKCIFALTTYEIFIQLQFLFLRALLPPSPDLVATILA